MRRLLSAAQPPNLTTAQRDALGAGYRGPGSTIYNTDRACAEINVGSDASPIWTQVGRPSFVTLAQFNALTPYDGQEVVLQLDSANGINGHYRYNAASASAKKWESVGDAAQLMSEVFAFETLSSVTYVDLATVGPQITSPRDADVRLDYGADCSETPAGNAQVWITPQIGATTAVTLETTANLSWGGGSATWNTNNSRKFKFDGVAAGGNIILKYRGNNTFGIPFRNRWLTVSFMRIA